MPCATDHSAWICDAEGPAGVGWGGLGCLVHPAWLCYSCSSLLGLCMDGALRFLSISGAVRCGGP